MVKNLKVINYWGDLCSIPDTLTTNLTKHTAWSLARDVELRTTREDEEYTAWSLAEEVDQRTREGEAIIFCRSDVCDTYDDDDDNNDDKVPSGENKEIFADSARAQLRNREKTHIPWHLDDEF